MRRILATFGAFVLLGIAVAVAVEVGVPIGGLSRSDAIAAARDYLPPSTPSSVEWATPGFLAFFSDRPFGSAQQWQEPVWAVRFRGTFKVGCGPSAPPGQTAHCPPDGHTATVVIGYRTGIPVFLKVEQ